MWEYEIIEYKNFLKLERSLSENSISAYVNDVNKFVQFLEIKNLEISMDENDAIGKNKITSVYRLL